MLYIHEKYGDVVRTAPNVLSFRQPQAIKDIYGAGKHYKKVSSSISSAQVSTVRDKHKSHPVPVTVPRLSISVNKKSR